MPSADGQRIAIESFQVKLEMPQRRTLQAFDPFAGDQGVAVDTHEAFAEFVFQGLQRFVQQHFALRMAQGHVLVVGNEEDHVLQGDQFDPLAGPRADVAARSAATGGRRLGQRGQLHAVRPRAFFSASARSSLRTGLTR